ncbi:MAG: response regulator transcription factor [Rhizomicrobium sp.]
MEGAGYYLFVIHDDPDTRRSIDALASSLGIQCEAFSSAEVFLNRFAPSMAGCLLADLRIEETGGLELQRALAARGSILPIIFLSDAADLTTAVQAMKNGALTVIPMPFRAEELAEAVRRGLEINRESREIISKRAEVRRRLESLTAKERRVLEMIIEGIPNKRITRVFGVSQRTVARLRARVYEKMCVESAFELARVIANSEVLPAVKSQQHLLVNGKEFRTDIADDYTRDIVPESGGRQAVLPPPHFQQDQRHMPSGRSDRKHV